MNIWNNLKKPEFDRGFRGYSMADVDRYIDYIVDRYSAVQKENSALKKRLSDMQNENDEGMKIIEDAQNKAQKIVSDADGKASKTLDEAKAEAEKITRDADDASSKILDKARVEAKKITCEAENEARRIRDKAAADADEIRAETERLIEGQLQTAVSLHETASSLYGGLANECSHHMDILSALLADSNDFVRRTAALKVAANDTASVGTDNVPNAEASDSDDGSDKDVKHDIADADEGLDRSDDCAGEGSEVEAQCDGGADESKASVEPHIVSERPEDECGDGSVKHNEFPNHDDGETCQTDLQNRADGDDANDRARKYEALDFYAEGEKGEFANGEDVDFLTLSTRGILKGMHHGQQETKKSISMRD